MTTPVPTPLPTPPEGEPPLFPPRVQAALMALCVVIAILLGFRGWQRSAYANRPLVLLPSYHVDLNSATLAELELLPGIGSTLAARIETYRQSRNGFHDVAELCDIQGIGPVLFEQLKDRVSIGPFRELSPPGRADVSAPGMSKLPLGTKLDPNTAPVDLLERVPGLGKTLATRIVAGRQSGRFHNVDELRRVRGIGPKTLESVRPYLQIETGK